MRLSQSPEILASPIKYRVALLILSIYEATLRFTRVTTCRFASPPQRGFVGPLRRDALPHHTRSHATGLTGIYPGRHFPAD